MARKLLIPLSAAVAGALITASPASAVTCDQVQPALNGSVPGAVITIDEGEECPGTIFLPAHKVTLQGAGTGATLVGDDEVRILSGNDVQDTVVRNLRFDDGWGSTPGGGAIRVTGFSPITISDSVFTDNSARGPGGAVYVDASEVIGEPNERARALAGGESPRVRILDSTFGGDGDGDANSSETRGGAVAVDDAPVEVDGSTFSGNESGGPGGGLSVFSTLDVTVTGSTFEDNLARERGGGAELEFCSGTLTDNTFEDNTVEPFLDQFEGSLQRALGVFGGDVDGGGVYAEGTRCPQLDARAVLGDKDGDEPTLEQSGNRFVANVLAAGTEGEGEGAGEWAGDLTLRSTSDTFHANRVTGNAIGFGGALRYEDGEGAQLRNLSATANTLPAGDGGGVSYDSEGTTLHVVHGTIAANAIGEGQGSAIAGGSGQSLLVDNSIIHGNTGGPELAGFEEFVAVRALGEQAGGIVVAFSLACKGGAAYPGDGNLCADPKLVGAAAGDVHQTAASPTVDKASAARSDGLTADYEGDARPKAAGPDMGADEAPEPAKPEEQAQQPAAPAAPAAGGVLGTQARSCASRRSFRIKLRNRGRKVVKATVIVNGKRVKVLRGKRLTSRVNLRGLPKGRFTVRIRLELADGEVISGVRRYYTCREGRKSGPPKV